MLFNATDEEKFLFEIIKNVGSDTGVMVYIVGGYVRDRLLGRPSKDLDIVCIGDGIKFAQEVAGYLKPVPRVVVFRRFGTALLKHDDIEIEFVGARKESYRSDSRKPVVEPGSLEDDQNRRDFTINSLAVSLNEANYGEIIDPFNGLVHLEEKLIKTPLDPEKTFSDDPLRMLRAIRFSVQLDFSIDHETFEALSMCRNRIRIVSQERITLELEKIMAEPKPSTGFRMMFETGLLSIIFPELADMAGVEMIRGIGHKDNFYHTLLVLDNVAEKSKNIWLRWAALLHDIAKPATKRFDTENGWTFHGHEALGAAMVPRIFRKLKLPMDQKMRYVQKLVKLHLRPLSLTNENITDSAIRRLLFDAGDEIDDLLVLCEADITSKNPAKVKRYLKNYRLVREKLIEVEEKDRIRNWQPPISGEDIMNAFGIGPSKKVGQIKNTIREAILEGEIKNSFEEAYDLMLKEGLKLGLDVKTTDQKHR
jgi:poly(A) polymerase